MTPVLESDVHHLLMPVTDHSPAGEDVWTTTICDEIREARWSDDGYSQGVWEREVKTTNWQQVADLTATVLRHHSKDVRVAGFLVEAWVKVHGFAGLHSGLSLTRSLLEQYWETLFPEIDEEDGVEWRASALITFDEKVSAAVKTVPLTKRITSGENYCYLQWEESKQFTIPTNFDLIDFEEQEQAQQIKAQAAAEGKITTEDWFIAQTGTQRTFYEETLILIQDIHRECEAMDRVCDDRFGKHSPGLRRLTEAVENIRQLVEKITKEKRQQEPDPIPLSTFLQTDSPTHSPPPWTVTSPLYSTVEPNPRLLPVNSGQTHPEWAETMVATGTFSIDPIRTRQEGLARLVEVAEFFRHTEPHNPISYLISRAVRWSKMPLDAWLREVIKNDDVLEHLRQTIGIHHPG